MNLAEQLGVPQTNWLMPTRIPMPWEAISQPEVMEKIRGRYLAKKNCLHCGKEFQPREKRTKFCSLQCGGKHQAQKTGRVGRTVMKVKEEPKPRPKATVRQCKVKLVATCPTCHEKFQQRTHWQIYCTPKCNWNKDTGKLIPVTAGNLTFYEPKWRTK